MEIEPLDPASLLPVCATMLPPVDSKELPAFILTEPPFPLSDDPA